MPININSFFLSMALISQLPKPQASCFHRNCCLWKSFIVVQWFDCRQYFFNNHFLKLSDLYFSDILKCQVSQAFQMDRFIVELACMCDIIAMFAGFKLPVRSEIYCIRAYPSCKVSSQLASISCSNIPGLFSRLLTSWIFFKPIA